MEEQFGVKKNGNKKGKKGRRRRGRTKRRREAVDSDEDAFMCHRPRVWLELGTCGRHVWRRELAGLVSSSELCRWRFQQLTERWSWRTIRKLSPRSTWTRVPLASLCQDRYRWRMKRLDCTSKRWRTRALHTRRFVARVTGARRYGSTEAR